MHDTERAAAELQIGIYRKMTGVERLRIALDLTDAVRGLTMARLRKEHPTWTDGDLKRELIRYASLPGLPPRELR